MVRGLLTTVPLPALAAVVVVLAAASALGVPLKTVDGLPAAVAPPEERIDERRAERLILEEVNALRRSSGEPLLDWNDALAAPARSHSAYLVNTDRNGHTGPRGEMVGDRYPCRAAEVVTSMRAFERFSGPSDTYSPQTERELAAAAANMWQQSPGHHRIIHDPALRVAGTGLSIDGHEVRATMALC